MNNAFNSFATIFTGKGGTLRLAIFSSLAAGVIYEILDSRYGLSMTAKDGTSVTLKPTTTETFSDAQSESDECQFQSDIGNSTPPLTQ